MKPVVIVQHVANDGPSFFATWLSAQGIAFNVLEMFAGAQLPTDIRQYGGLCVLGGPMSANDDIPYFDMLRTLLRDAVRHGIPVIGHCLGGQILSQALGGTVSDAPHPEIGWSVLQPVDPQAVEWFGPGADHQLFQWHAQTFSIPPAATLLLQGTHCVHQAFAVDGIHLGMQFHCEVDRAKILSWLLEGAQEIQCATSPGVQKAEAILRNLDADLVQSQSIASTIYRRWATHLRH